VVAGQHAVRGAVLVEQLKRLAHRLERRRVGVLGQVAEVRHEHDVATRAAVVDHVAERLFRRTELMLFWLPPVEELGVGHDGQGAVRRKVRRFGPVFADDPSASGRTHIGCTSRGGNKVDRTLCATGQAGTNAR